MPAISAARSRFRYETILNAAADVFAERGFDSSSISDVATRAEVSEGLIYKYFRNKRDLLAQVLSAFNARTMDAMEREVARRSTFREKLECVIQQRLDNIAKYPGLTKLYISQVRAASDEPGLDINSLTARATQLWKTMVSEALASGELRVDLQSGLVRDAIWGSIEHISWLRMSGRRRIDTQKAAVELTNLFLFGISNAVRHSKTLRRTRGS
jgi:TetR/AcrR family fatty acid metabolism transcriptional regulator